MVESINPLACESWDDCVARLPGATFFHSRAWAQVLQETYGFTPHYLVAVAGGRIAGVAPIMEVDSWLTGRRGVTLPFTDACAWLGTPEIQCRLQESALERAAQQRWRHLEIHGPTDFEHAVPSLSYFHHVLDLTPPLVELAQRRDGAIGRGARKAERVGVEIESSRDWEGVRQFLQLFCQTRRKHGAPPQPMAFFERIHRRILAPGHGRILLARHQGRVIAAAMFFEFGTAALYKFGASDSRAQEFRPNNLIFDRAIADYRERGFTTLDLGRTSLTNEGLRRFKRSWGPREERLDYFRLNCRTHEFVAERDHAHGWHTRVFKLLPEWASRLIGAAAYRHIA
jgi:hypothetical protein